MIIPDKTAPACVGIIMDGNRRWAHAHHLPTVEGHTEGYKKLQEVVRWAREARIEHIAAYTFSTENWQRPKEEVDFLMKLFKSVLENEMQKMVEERVRVRFVGDWSRFSSEMQEMMRRAEARTAEDADLTLHLLMSYGGRAEIVAATSSLALKGGAETEDTFAKRLWSHEIPDIDLIIRTGGEKRLSGFLPWQSVYSELFFNDTLWPDLSREEFDAVLADFATRERRHGK